MLRKLKIITITGPTAVGKTNMGICLAEKLDSEIISVDSRQIYRYMDIGTAKPEKAELERTKHHLIDIIDPDQQYSAGAFGRRARELIKEMNERGKVPILVGGSGLYLQAVLDGFFEDTEDYSALRLELRQRLKNEGIQALEAELEHLDPITHSHLNNNDIQRILRALEVALVKKRGLNELWNARTHTPLHCTPLSVCLTRARTALYSRIDKRVDEMVATGLLDEVRNLLSLGYTRDNWALRTLGYEELLDFIEEKCCWQDAIEQIKRRSRQYAKRQLTWFRRDRRMRWKDVDDWGMDGVVDRVMSQVDSYFGSN